MSEITVAKPDNSMIAVAVIAAAVLLLAAIPAQSWGVRVLAVAIGVAAVRRFAQMRLSVTRSSVVVVNYTTRHEFPIDEVQIVDERDTSILLPDASGTPASGRTLYVMDRSGRKAHVALAPIYGSRLDTIAEDLYRAISTMKASR